MVRIQKTLLISTNLVIPSQMRITLFALFALVAFSCTEQDEAEREAIRRMLKGLIDADNNEDIRAVMSCYADDAVLVPPGKPLIEGLGAIRANYEGIFSKSALELTIEVDTVFVYRDAGAAYGYTGGKVNADDGSMRPVRDRYIALVAKVEGNWRIRRLMWSPEPEPPLQPASN